MCLCAQGWILTHVNVQRGVRFPNVPLPFVFPSSFCIYSQFKRLLFCLAAKILGSTVIISRGLLVLHNLSQLNLDDCERELDKVMKDRMSCDPIAVI